LRPALFASGRSIGWKHVRPKAALRHQRGAVRLN
jgi:hypothetical protein